MAIHEVDDLDIAVADVSVVFSDEVFTLTTSHTSFCDPCINKCT